MGAAASVTEGRDAKSRVRALGRLAAAAQAQARTYDGAANAPARDLLRSSPEAHDCFLSEDHGYLAEVAAPLLPTSHIVWEKMGGRLRSLVTSGADVCKAMRRMKELSATEMALPDRHLRRAATLLGSFAHATWHFSHRPRGATVDEFLPASLLAPWTEVCRRMGRPCGQLTLLDYVSHNIEFRVNARLEEEVNEEDEEDAGKDLAYEEPAEQPDEAHLSYTDLDETFAKLRPNFIVFGNQAEEVAFLGVVDLQRALADTINTILHAQECVIRDEPDGLLRELARLRTQHVEVMISKMRAISPDPMGRTRCDPVSFGKTVARLTAALPLAGTEAAQNQFASLIPSLGTAPSSPTPVLDAVIGFSSESPESAAAQVARALQDSWAPSLHRDFLAALNEVSIREYVAASDDRALQAAFDALVECYAGDGGYLDTHRRLVHAYEEIGSLVAWDRLPHDCLRHPNTASGDISVPEGGGWLDVCAMLDEARRERLEATRICPPFVPAKLKHRAAVRAEHGESKASHLILDVADLGVLFEPGDRCAVLITNDSATTERMLQALGVDENTLVALNERWLAGLAHRRKEPLPGDPPKLAIRDFLDAALLSPLNHHMISMLTDLLVATNVDEEHAAAELAAEFELWKLLQILSQLGVDLRLCLVPHLAQLFPPLTSRTYSICAPAKEEKPKELEFTVGKQEVEDDNSEKWSEVMNYIYDSLQHPEDETEEEPEGSGEEEEEDEVERQWRIQKKTKENARLVNAAMERLLGSFTGVASASVELSSGEKSALREAISVSIRSVWDEWELLSSHAAPPEHGDTLNVMKPDHYHHEQSKRQPAKVLSDYDARSSGATEVDTARPTASLHADEPVKHATADSSATFVHHGTADAGAGPMAQTAALTRRAGVGSHFLHRLSQDEVVPVSTRPLRHFRAPYSERRAPVIMVACGGGIATFRAMMEERMRLRNKRGVEVGEMWLLWGARTRSHLAYRAEIEHFVEEELATVEVALSHEDYEFTCVLTDEGQLDSRIQEGGQHRSIASILAAPAAQAKLWHWLQADAVIYVAGQSAGMGIVSEAIVRAAEAAQVVPDAGVGVRYLQALVADGRIRTDVTGAVLSPSAERPPIGIADVVRHGGGDDGVWIVYKSKVYDLGSKHDAALWYPSGAPGLLEKAGRDCTEQITAANCHGIGTAQTEGLLSACSIADLRCVFFDHDEEPERQLYVRWRDFMMLALQLRNAFRLEFHDTPIGASMDVAAEDSELVPSARASTARCEPRPLSALEDGGTHRKFWRLTLPLLAANIVELAEQTMPTFDKRGGPAIQTLTGIRDRVGKLLESAEMDFVSQWLSLPPKAKVKQVAAFRNDFTRLDLDWLDELVVCGADGTDEIETSLAHTSNLEALMRRRIALVCPELDAGFRRADHDNSGALDRSELVQLLVDAGVEMDESRMDEVMLKLDSNGDGKISYEEFLTVMRVGEYSKKGKEGALASLEVVLPSKLNEMVNGLQRLVSKLGLAAIQYASQ